MDVPSVSTQQPPDERSAGFISTREWENVAPGTDLLDLLRASPGVHPYTSNSHLGTVKDPLIHTSQKRIRKRIRFWKHLFDAAYLAEFTQEFLEWDTCKLGNTAEDLR